MRAASACSAAEPSFRYWRAQRSPAVRNEVSAISAPSSSPFDPAKAMVLPVRSSIQWEYMPCQRSARSRNDTIFSNRSTPCVRVMKFRSMPTSIPMIPKPPAPIVSVFSSFDGSFTK